MRKSDSQRQLAWTVCWNLYAVLVIHPSVEKQ
jgi:hypothetical protein